MPLPFPSHVREPDADAEEALWIRHRAGDTSARTALFAHYLDFAEKMARRRYRDRSQGDLDSADLTQQASSALLEAIDRFDQSRGIPFRAFASHRIAGSLSDFILRSSDLRAQQAARARVRRERIDSLIPDETARLSADAALDALFDLAAGLAIGFMLDEAATTEEAELRAGAQDGYRSAAWNELIVRLRTELERLPEREALIVRHHYLAGVAFETLASLLGVSRGRISQLHHSALLTLKKRLGGKGHFSLQR